MPPCTLANVHSPLLISPNLTDVKGITFIISHYYRFFENPALKTKGFWTLLPLKSAQSARRPRKLGQVAFVARGRGGVARVAREHRAAHGIVGDVSKKHDIHPI